MDLCTSKERRTTIHQSWRVEKNFAAQPGVGELGSNQAKQ